MVYQLIALNVAINSYDHALLTLLVSNQFVEIKGSVFKKFEKDSLFQITCAGMYVNYQISIFSFSLVKSDIVERFSLALMLCMVAFRNLIELSGSEFDFSGGFGLPKSFGWFRGNNVLWTISYVGVSPNNPFECLIMFAPASINSHGLGDARRLAETRLYHQVQPHSAISIRAVY